MKRFITFYALFLLITEIVSAQVIIPNGDFENSNGNFISNWDLKSGSAQVREFLILTGSSGNITIEPASGEKFVTLMNDAGSLGKLETNFPLNARPEYFSFYCGYIPGTPSGEKFGFFLIFTKFNSSKGMNDTILGVGGYLPASGQIVPWARISGSLSSYYQSSEIPDHAQIIFMTDVATNGMGQIIASPNTLLAIDKVEFPLTLSTNENITISNLDEFKAYPNPFSSSTNISYKLLSNSHVKIQVFDISGKILATLVNEQQERGNHIATYNPTMIQKGIYFYRIETNLGVQTGKLILK